MAGGYQVGIGSETKAFKQGVESGIIEPLEDAQKELLELGRNRGPEQLERAMKDAEKATDDLADETKKAARAIESDFRDTYRTVKDKSDDAFDKASEGAEDFKQEVGQSAREAAASFDGSMESIADLGQEIAANAFSGFGPAGAAAGIAVAGAAGVMIENFNKITESADEAREAAFSMAYEVAGALDAAGYAQRLQEWTNDTEKFKQARDIAVLTGWDEVEVIDALAAGGDKLDKLTAAQGRGADAVHLTNGRLWELDAVLKATGEGYLNGTQAAEVNARALYRFAEQAGTATGEVDDLGNAIMALPDGTEVVIDAKTQRAYENVDQLEHKVAGVKGKTVTLDVRTDTSTAERSLQRFINKGRQIKIGSKIVGPAGNGGWE